MPVDGSVLTKRTSFCSTHDIELLVGRETLEVCAGMGSCSRGKEEGGEERLLDTVQRARRTHQQDHGRCVEAQDGGA